MIDSICLSRRTLLAGSTAASLCSATTVAANAASATVAARNAGFYRFSVGSFSAIAVSDGQIALPAHPAYAPNASAADVEAALARNFLPPKDYSLDANLLVVDTGSQRVLIDAGWSAGFSPLVGHGARRLAEAGIDPASIDAVVLTHAHPDHIGGLTIGERREPTYPNAEIVIAEAEWRHWTADSLDFGGMLIEEAMKPLFADAVRRNLIGLRDRVRRVSTDQEIVPGVTVEAAPGHTPGHATVRIASGPNTLLVTADSFHNQAFDLDQPHWRTVFDFDAALAEATRRRILDAAATDRLLLFGYHMPFPALGTIVALDRAYRWLPTRWSVG